MAKPTREQAVANLRAYLDELDELTRSPGEPPLREAVAQQARERLAEMDASRERSAQDHAAKKPPWPCMFGHAALWPGCTACAALYAVHSSVGAEQDPPESQGNAEFPRHFEHVADCPGPSVHFDNEVCPGPKDADEPPLPCVGLTCWANDRHQGGCRWAPQQNADNKETP